MVVVKHFCWYHTFCCHRQGFIVFHSAESGLFGYGARKNRADDILVKKLITDACTRLAQNRTNFFPQRYHMSEKQRSTVFGRSNTACSLPVQQQVQHFGTAVVVANDNMSHVAQRVMRYVNKQVTITKQMFLDHQHC